MAQTIKAADIRAGMAARWRAPEWAIMWEVGDATGAYRKRYADAVMMSLWPSRGLELHGVEIKVSRSDWRREALDPTKAELIAQFCDRWWVHAAPGVVDDISAMPPAWGLREFDGKQWMTRREAAKTDAKPMTREFLASMATRIGMQRRWYQGDHYDVSVGKRALAVAYGARAISLRECGLMMAVYRRTGRLPLPENAAAEREALRASKGGNVNDFWSRLRKMVGLARYVVISDPTYPILSAIRSEPMTYEQAAYCLRQTPLGHFRRRMERVR